MDKNQTACAILVKMLEANVFVFPNTSNNAEKQTIKDANAERVNIICDAYKAVYQAIASPAK